MQARKKGLFGKVTSAFGVTETQQRGTLHNHVMIFTEVPSSLYIDLAPYPILFKELAATLDNIVTATMTENGHVQGVMATVMKIPPPRSGYFECPDSVEGDEFEKLIEQEFNSTQVHTHSFTCFKK